MPIIVTDPIDKLDLNYEEFVRGQLTTKQINHILVAGSLGLNGEAGEVADQVKKMLFHGREDAAADDELIEEMGDTLFYLTALVRVYFNEDLNWLAQQNVDKVRARFPNGIIDVLAAVENKLAKSGGGLESYENTI